jgi:Ulp1 family protease
MPIDQLTAQHRKILFPVNWKGSHWLLVTLDVTGRQVVFTDSLASFTGEQGRGSIFKVGVMCVQKPYPFSDGMQTLQREFSLSDGWTTLSTAAPQQLSSCDCGVYCCQFIKYAYFDRPIPKWDKKDAIQLRNMMTLELYEGSLRWFGD